MLITFPTFLRETAIKNQLTSFTDATYSETKGSENNQLSKCRLPYLVCNIKGKPILNFIGYGCNTFYLSNLGFFFNGQFSDIQSFTIYVRYILAVALIIKVYCNKMSLVFEEREYKLKHTEVTAVISQKGHVERFLMDTPYY
ncbi:hypothetical protein T06_6057 [Trichinella sp. T6]|nr:hypothetical protein T06_6057 [Trichinella sp. T6]